MFAVSHRAGRIEIDAISHGSLSTSKAMHPYDDKPLVGERDIRLLEISRGRRGEPIVCSLSVVDLDSAPSHLALSYTWGASEKTHTVTCDGKDLKITANLHAALERYRQPDENMVIWADAICIDQSDNQERSHQVQLMRSIYAGAPGTFVYLGEPGAIVAPVKQLWLSLKKAEERLDRDQTLPLSELENYDLPPAGSHSWTALAELFSLPWFFRVWVVQEFAVSREIFWCYGDGLFPPFVLLDICRTLVHHQLLGALVAPQGEFAHRPGLEFLTRRFTRVQWLADLRESIKHKAPRHLEQVLCQTSRGTNGATEPHDQIYALLGLASDTDGPDIYPDYTQTPRETYLQACQHMIANGSEGKFLHKAGHPQKVAGLPSWVPDWSVAKASSDILNCVDFGTVSKYQAGGTSQARWRLTDDARILIGQGQLVDYISGVGTGVVSSESEEDHYRLLNAHFLASKALIERTNTIPVGSDVAEAHFRLLTMNKTDTDLVSRGVTFAFYEAFQRGINGLLPPLGKPREEEWYQRGTFIGIIESLGLGRRFCLSANRYLGQVPGDSLVGDQICVFPGMKTPFVVRKDPKNMGCYLLIGDCYIDGLMYGEALIRDDLCVQDIALV
jgi:hypothetical protein